jgi:AAA15 family ATPase/GTPase
MKPTKFRIKNYKSIADSGDCYFAEKITILAGKNECGKTSILEALADFHEDKEITPDKKRMGSSDDEIPTISVSFESTKTEVIKFAKENNLKVKVSGDKIKFDIQKTSSTNQYSIHNLDGLAFEEKEKTDDEILSEVQEKIEGVHVNLTTELSNKDIDAIKQKINLWISAGRFVGINNIQQIIQTRHRTIFQEVLEMLEKQAYSQPEEFTEKFIEKQLPYFILFSSFEDVFPDSIGIAELKDT